MTALSEVARLDIEVNNQVSEGAAAAARDLGQVEAAADRAAVALQEMESGTRLVGDTFEKTAARSDVLARAELRRAEITSRAEREIVALTAAADREGRSADQLAAAISAVTLRRDADIARTQRQAEVQRAQQLALVGGASAQTQALAGGTDAMARYGAAHDDVGKKVVATTNSLRLTAREMAMLSPQIADVGVTLAMGMSPLMVLIQQGPQITSAVGGVERAFTLLRAAAVVAAPAILAIGIPAAMIASYAALETRMSGLRASLRGVSDDYQRTAAAVEAASTRISQAGLGVSRGEANASQLAFRRAAPEGAVFDFEALTRQAADFAKVIGSDVTSASEQLARAMRDPAALVKELGERNFPGMNSALQLTVERLVQGGERGDAFRLVMGRIANATAGAARDISPFTAATRDLGSAWGTFWDDTLKSLAGPGERLASWLADRLRDVQRLREARATDGTQQPALGAYGVFYPRAGAAATTQGSDIAGLDRQIAEAAAALAAAMAAASRGGSLAGATSGLRATEIDRLQTDLTTLQASRLRYGSMPGRPSEGSSFREPEWAAGLAPASGRLMSFGDSSPNDDYSRNFARQFDALLDRASKIARGEDGRPVSTQSVETQRGVIARNIETLQSAAATGRATPEQLEAYTRGLEAQRVAYEGTLTVAERLSRSEQERTGVLGHLNPVQRELAEAVQQYRDAQRAAGLVATPEGEATAQADRLRRLQTEYRGVTDAATRQAESAGRVTAAYGVSTEAGRRAELQERAMGEVRKSGIQGAQAQTTATALLTAEYDKNSRSLAERAQIQRNAQSRDDLAYMQREAELIGANADARERELAALRARQGAGAAAGTPAAQEAESLAVRLVDARRNTDQLRNSWNELSSFGERTFSKIGDAITEGFAQGKISAINFGNIAKAVMSEVVQSAMRLAVINPILNSAFGGARGTLGGITQVAGMGGGSSGAATITDTSGNIIGQIGNMSSGQTIMGGLRGVNPGNYINGTTPFNTGWGAADGLLNTSIFGSGSSTISTAEAAAATGGMVGDSLAVGGGAGSAGLTVGGAALGAAGIAGGLYGLYSGIQRGGVGGYTSAAGGAAAAGLSAAAMAGMAIPVYGWIAAAVLSIIGSLLPGQKASGKGQEFRLDLGSGETEKNGLTGDRFSPQNAGMAEAATMTIANLASEISGKLGGAAIGGEIAVGVTSGRGGDDKGNLYLDISGRKASFANDEEGSKQLAERAGEYLLELFKDYNGGDGDYAGILLRASGSIEKLGENLDWYEGTYKALTGTAEATSEFGKQIAALNAQWQTAIDKAAELSLATEVLNSKRDEDIAKAYAARDLQVRGFDLGLDIRSARATGGDDSALMLRATLMQFDLEAEQQLVQSKATLEALGKDSDEVATRIARNEQVLAEERLGIQRDYAEKAAGITKQSAAAAANSALSVVTSLRDYVRGLSTSEASAGTVLDRFGAASQDFNAIYGAARAGDANSISGIQGAAETYRALAREVYGGGQGYADAIALIGDRLGSIGDLGSDGLTQAFVRENDRQNTDRIVDAVADLKAENARLRADINQLLAMPRVA